MTLSEDVNLEEFVMTKDEFSGADIKAICTEAGLLALRERRMKVKDTEPLGLHSHLQATGSNVWLWCVQVTNPDFKKAKEKVMFKKKEGLYM